MPEQLLSFIVSLAGWIVVSFIWFTYKRKRDARCGGKKTALPVAEITVETIDSGGTEIIRIGSVKIDGSKPIYCQINIHE